MATNVQVYEDPNSGQWGARVVGDDQTEPRLYGSKEEAIQEGRRLAEERGGDLLIHGEEGETQAIEAPDPT